MEGLAGKFKTDKNKDLDVASGAQKTDEMQKAGDNSAAQAMPNTTNPDMPSGQIAAGNLPQLNEAQFQSLYSQ